MKIGIGKIFGGVKRNRGKEEKRKRERAGEKRDKSRGERREERGRV